MNKFLFILFLFITTAIHADTVDVILRWDPPTEYADGTPLRTEDISGYNLKWIRCDWLPAHNFYTLENVNEYKLVGLETNLEYCFWIRTIATNGLTSPYFPSDGPRKYIFERKPGEPREITVVFNYQ